MLEDLRRSVVWRPAGCCQARPVLHHVAQAEVADLEILIRVEQQIFKLQVAMGDTLAVAEN